MRLQKNGLLLKVLVAKSNRRVALGLERSNHAQKAIALAHWRYSVNPREILFEPLAKLFEFAIKANQLV